ncbi:MAG: HlyC/CorC family transporter [Candidatus Wallbacteria bacterium]|nr:HlyC/CorC family transporter [Candidatus Wallbacteria bacterium]
MLILLTVSVLLALVFAGAEAALLALSEGAAGRPRDPLPARLERMLGDPEPLLQSLVVGNLAAVALAGTSLALLLIRSHGLTRGLMLGGLLLAPLVALVTEVFPRLMTRARPGSFLTAILLPLAAFARVTRPVALAGSWAGVRLAAAAERLLVLAAPAPRAEPGSVTRRVTSESLEGEQEKMIGSVLEFGETLVKEAMVPRRDMAALPADAGLEATLALVRETQYSRLPIYRGKPENVTGVVHSKDLLPCAHGLDPEPFSMPRLARRPLYVPGVMTLDDLLTEFQLKGNHMAFVVDEFGSTAGLITLEDVLEEIFGEIQDEHDREEQPIRRVGRSAWIVVGTTAIDEVETVLRVEFPDTGCDTLGGLVFHCLGHLPEPGETCVVEGVTLEVLRVEKRRVQEVRVLAGAARDRWKSSADS